MAERGARNGASVTTSYIRAYKTGLDDRGKYPRIWAMHFYSAGGYTNVETRVKQLKSFLSTTGSARVWMTEQGGRIRRNSRVIHTESDQNAIVARLLRLPKDAGTSRVTRFYLYQWKGEPKYDSGLIDFANDSARGSYSIFKARTNP